MRWLVDLLMNAVGPVNEGRRRDADVGRIPSLPCRPPRLLVALYEPPAIKSASDNRTERGRAMPTSIAGDR